MRRVVLALPLAAALAIGMAPIVSADEPTPVDVTLPEGTSVCLDQRVEVTNFTMRLERTEGDLQLSDGATVRILPVVTLGPEHPGEVTIGTSGNAEIALPADWSSQPEGTMSDGIEWRVFLGGLSQGTMPALTFTWQVEVLPPGEGLQGFPGTVDTFEVVDCTPTPSIRPTPTIPPSDTDAMPTHEVNASVGVLIAALLASTTLLLMPARLRRRR